MIYRRDDDDNDAMYKKKKMTLHFDWSVTHVQNIDDVVIGFYRLDQLHYNSTSVTRTSKCDKYVRRLGS